jgi:hypothetical protein
MLALRGKSQVGNMLHVTVGPESDLFCDIHGAAVLDVTPLLMEMNGSQHVYLTLTRCRSEQTTSRSMVGAGITHLSSFGTTEEGAAAAAAAGPGVFTPPGTEQTGAAPKKEEDAPKTKAGPCEYCSQPSQLLPIPGFHICKVCAQIELGRLKQNTNEDQSDEPDPVC